MLTSRILTARFHKLESDGTGRHCKHRPLVAALLAATVAMPLCPDLALADDVDDAQAAVDDATTARDDILTRIDTLERELDAAHLAVPVAKENLRKCVRDSYKLQQELGQYGYIEAILECDSLDDVILVMATRQRIQHRSVELASQVTEKCVALEDSKTALSEELSQAEMTLEEANDALAERQAEAEEAKRQAAAVYGTNYSGASESGNVSLSTFKMMGVVYQNGYRYTYYEESVLPGPGLVIPGRHHEDGFIMDGDGYICVASNDLAYGTVVPVPFDGRMGKVYDSGCASGTLDIYIV